MVKIIYDVKIGPRKAERRVAYVDKKELDIALHEFRNEYALSRPRPVAAEILDSSNHSYRRRE